MRLFKPMLLFWITFLLIGGWLFQTASVDRSASAQTGATATPTGQAPAKRKAKIKIPYTQHDWWLIRYSNNKIVCGLSVDHEGLPVANDVKTFCDQKTYNDWLQTKPCDLSVADSYNQ